MVPLMLPEAVPGFPGVSAVQVAQAMLSAWARGAEAAQRAIARAEEEQANRRCSRISGSPLNYFRGRREASSLRPRAGARQWVDDESLVTTAGGMAWVGASPLRT